MDQVAALGADSVAPGADEATNMMKKIIMQQMMGGGQQAPAYQQAPIRGAMRGQGSGLGGLLGKGVQTMGGLAALNMMKPRTPEPGQLATRPSIPQNENLGADGVYRGE